jgi:hypothetical protein
VSDVADEPPCGAASVAGLLKRTACQRFRFLM